MAARCTFCGADLPSAPMGAAIRCPSCGNLTSTPALPPTAIGMQGFAAPAPAPAPSTALPFANVDGKKQAASPPPSVVLPSRAGGVDELIGGGITILGIGIVKLTLLAFVALGFTCLLSMLGLAFR